MIVRPPRRGFTYLLSSAPPDKRLAKRSRGLSMLGVALSRSLPTRRSGAEVGQRHRGASRRIDARVDGPSLSDHVRSVSLAEGRGIGREKTRKLIARTGTAEVPAKGLR